MMLPADSCSLPREVCTVISDADCVTPMETICSEAAPSPDCQLILRQFFNDSGVFCINVSLTNDVSLAVASARVSVNVGRWTCGRTSADRMTFDLGVISHCSTALCLQPLVAAQLGLQPLSWESCFWPALPVASG